MAKETGVNTAAGDLFDDFDQNMVMAQQQEMMKALRDEIMSERASGDLQVLEFRRLQRAIVSEMGENMILEPELRSLMNELEDVPQDNNGNVDAMEAYMNHLHTQLQEKTEITQCLESEVRSLREKVKELTKQCDDQSHLVEEKQRLLETLKEKEMTIAAHNGEKAGLVKALEIVDNSIVSMIREHNKASSQNVEVVEKLKKENEGLRKEMEGLQKEIEGLRKENAEMQRGKARLDNIYTRSVKRNFLGVFIKKEKTDGTEDIIRDGRKCDPTGGKGCSDPACSTRRAETNAANIEEQAGTYASALKRGSCDLVKAIKKNRPNDKFSDEEPSTSEAEIIQGLNDEEEDESDKEGNGDEKDNDDEEDEGDDEGLVLRTVGLSNGGVLMGFRSDMTRYLEYIKRL